MNALVDVSKLDVKVGSYLTGKSDSLKDPKYLRLVRMRRRQLGQMMRAYDHESAKHRVPEGDYFISRKIDGEFTCLIYEKGDIISLNPGGTVRMGAAVFTETAKLLKKAGVKSALLGGELDVRRDDGERSRVHDVVGVARAPADEDDVNRLCMGIFNIYDLDGEDLSMRYAEAIKRLQEIFAKGDRVRAVETVVGDKKAVFKQFKKWVIGEGSEGVVLRSDSAGIYKIKTRHTLDLAVVGYAAGIDDREGLLHSLLLAIVREDNSFQVISRVGGGFSDEQRRELLKMLEKKDKVETEYSEVNSDRVAYQMIAPGLVIEISCLDIVSRTSHGSTIDRMVLDWNDDKQRWEGVRRIPLCSILSPQFLRIRDDKEATPEDVKISQLTDIADIPEVHRVAEDLQLPASKVLKRAVATKQLRGATMVRKLIIWKTNKAEASADFPAYVLHLTNYSPNRKSPLDHEIRVSSSIKQIEALYEDWQEKYFVGGWTRVE